jgi:hypothetical protein
VIKNATKLSMINFQTKSLKNLKEAQLLGRGEVVTNYADLNTYLFQKLKPMDHPQKELFWHISVSKRLIHSGQPGFECRKMPGFLNHI